MRDAGIPVVVVDSTRSVDNVGSLTQEVARALGVPDVGRRLADRLEKQTRSTLAEIAAVAPKRVQDKPRMVFLYVRGQAGVYYMFGEGSGADTLITALGGYDVAGEIGWNGMKPVTDEGIIDAQPDVVLMMTKGLESVDGVDGLLERLPALAQTPAGQKRRIVDMSDAQILGYGPRTAAVLEALAVAVYAPGSARALGRGAPMTAVAGRHRLPDVGPADESPAPSLPPVRRGRAGLLLGALGVGVVVSTLVSAGQGQLDVPADQVLGSVLHRVGLDVLPLPTHPQGDNTLW
ncbi:MAG: ABC transporter substrate-binding protein, partial [Aeromicrobium erythreum]